MNRLYRLAQRIFPKRFGSNRASQDRQSQPGAQEQDGELVAGDLTMSPAEIRALVMKMDTKNSKDDENAWDQLRPMGIAVVPFLAEAYPKMKKWQGRVSCVFRSTKYAQVSDAAFELGIAALQDRATLVRYRACGLLAYSLRKSAIPHLKKLLDHTDEKTAEDARAAIDAITRKNHHYFMDRSHSGKTYWRVNAADTELGL